MLIQEMKEILRDLNDKFLNKFFESFWKHQPKVMCYFEDTNHDIHRNFKVFKNSFRMHLIRICNVFHV